MTKDLALHVRLAARGAARHGLVTAYGHVSARLDDRHFLVSAPQPLGTIKVGDAGIVVSLDQPNLPEGVLQEVRIHREIYRKRPDVSGICRVLPPSVMALSALGKTPRALTGVGTYFAPCPPLWRDPQLIRDDQRAVEIAQMIEDKSAIVMRGNGAVTVGASIEEALTMAVYLEDASKFELSLLAASASGETALEFTAEESNKRATKSGGLVERMWHYLCAEDPEWELYC